MTLWHVSKGTSRVVIAVPSVGAAIKFPRIRKKYFGQFWSDAWRYSKEMLPNPDLGVRKMYWEFVGLMFKRNLWLTFRGVLENWSERSFYKHTDIFSRLMLQPTHFSFFGLLNIQRYGKPAEESDSEPIYHVFFPVAGQDLIRDGHHWCQSKNFYLAPDGPKLLDYGSMETQQIVGKYGLALYTRFDIKAGRAQTEEFRQARRRSS